MIIPGIPGPAQSMIIGVNTITGVICSMSNQGYRLARSDLDNPSRSEVKKPKIAANKKPPNAPKAV